MRLLIIFGFLALNVQLQAQIIGADVSDSQGNYYETVHIGEQLWITSNLNVSFFRNGDPIPYAKTKEDWKKAKENKTPAWCYSNNDPSLSKLYNAYAVIDTRGLAPEGWHVPSKTEWEELIDFLGENGPFKMKNSTGWGSQYVNGSNSSGLGLLPTYKRHGTGEFFPSSQGYCFIWSSSIYGYTFHIWMNGKEAHVQNDQGGEGYTVRCIMNRDKIEELKNYYASGKLKFIGNFKNGSRTGEWKYYYESGELKKTVNFVEGIKKEIKKLPFKVVDFTSGYHVETVVKEGTWLKIGEHVDKGESIYDDNGSVYLYVRYTNSKFELKIKSSNSGLQHTDLKLYVSFYDNLNREYRKRVGEFQTFKVSTLKLNESKIFSSISIPPGAKVLQVSLDDR